MFRWLAAVALLLLAAEVVLSDPPITEATLVPVTDPGAPTEVLDPNFAGLEATLIAEGLPGLTDVTGLPGSDALLVTDKRGKVLVVEDGRVLPDPFIDLTDWVESKGNEQGLVTVELHPDFENNRKVYLFFTDVNEDSQLVEVVASQSDQYRADIGSLRPILELPQDQQYHQSGSIEFGPDGNLWLSLGDGGWIGDPFNRGQNPTNLFATVVRLDVDGATPYGIPSDNPFVDSPDGERREIWAYGLRNPWRIAIDDVTGDIYIPDVGQAGSEEVNISSLGDGGQNFGWSITEGTLCFGTEICSSEGQTLPIFEYLHAGDGCAIVGGGVYRGEAIPELHGHYFFADYCLGWVRSFVYADGQVTQFHDWQDDFGRLGTVSSFGTDASGELYVTNLQGEIWRLERASDS